MTSTATPDKKPEPESFSVESAKLGVEDLLNLIPKSKKLDALGAANEVFLVIDRLAAKAGITGDARRKEL